MSRAMRVLPAMSAVSCRFDVDEQRPRAPRVFGDHTMNRSKGLDRAKGEVAR